MKGRGAPLVAEVIARLAKAKTKPRALTAAELAAAERAAGVALSPAMRAVMAFDAGFLKREYGWFDGKWRLRARPLLELIAEQAGPLADSYAPLVEARFPGLALPLDFGSDSMRFLYLGHADANREYPVLFIDHDDSPRLGVEEPSFDVYLAAHFDPTRGRPAASRKRAIELLGVPVWDAFEHAELALPAPRRRKR